jgi:hypothetical protein
MTGYEALVSSGTKLLADLDCFGKQGVNLSIRISPQDSSIFTFYLDGGRGPVGGIKVERLNGLTGPLTLYSYGGDGVLPIMNLSSTVFTNITIAYTLGAYSDTSTNQSFAVYVDGVAKVSGKPLLNRQDGYVTAVKFEESQSSTYIDYIRFAVSDLSREFLSDKDYETAKKASILSECVGSSNRDFTTSPPGNFNSSVMTEYCNFISPQDGVCSFTELQGAIKINPVCYGQAFAHCVDKTWSYTAGFETAGDKEMRQQYSSAGLDGAAACNAALAASVSFNSFMVPFFSVMWSIVTARPLLAVVLVFLVVLWLAISRVRRK